MCQHLPACPAAQAPDRMAARVAAGHPEQGWSLLCNGIVLFEDGGALLTDGQAVAPPASAVPAASGVVNAGMTRIMAGGDPRRARENRVSVRRLLREKQPGFAAALEAVVSEWAERDPLRRPGREPDRDAVDWPGRCGESTDSRGSC